MTRRSRRLLWSAGSLAALFSIEPALADAIDGDWCSDDGRHFSIQGPAIVTPGGSHLQGSYSRHSFVYTVPENEPDRGEQVFMRLLSEIAVQVQVGSGGSQTWHRCTATTS